MTKQVRIENADLSDHKVVIEVWQKSYLEGQPDQMIKTTSLASPTAMITECIWKEQYLVIKEG